MKIIRSIVAVLASIVPGLALAAAAIVNTPAIVNSGSTYTAETGSNRAVVIGLCREASTASTTPTVTAASWGTPSIANGQLVQAVVASQTTLTARITCYIWYVREANIPSGSQTFSVTWSTTMGGAVDAGTFYTLSGVDQTTTVDAIDSRVDTTGTTVWTQSPSVGAGTVQILRAGNNNTNSSTPDAAWTELQDTSDTNYRNIGHYSTASSGGPKTWSLTYGAANNGVVVMASFVGSAAGKAYTTLTSVAAGTWCQDFNTAVDPDIATGDIVRIDTTTTPDGYAITHGVDCSLEYAGSEARQTVKYDVFDTSAGALMPGGPGQLVFNDQAPSCGSQVPLIVDVNAAMTAFDLNSQCSDFEGDALTYTVTSGTLPTGLSLAASTGLVTGTPTVENEAGAAVTFTATDPFGATSTQQVVFYPIDTITTPTCTGGVGVGNCVASIEAKFLSTGTVTFDCSASVASSNVISQSPAAATEVEPGTAVSLVVSTGVCPANARRTSATTRSK